MTAVSLSEFLLARYAEDEDGARGELAIAARPSLLSHQWVDVMRRVLTDVEAKRRIVGLMRERHPYYNSLQATAEERGEDRMHGLVGKLLALPYADHPDYRPEWKP